MARYTLENTFLRAEVDTHGAELKSLLRKPDGREMMWQGDPAFWGRTSPVLFPVVGCYRDKTSYYKDKAYSMGQHGFARDMEFTLDSQTEEELWFSVTDNEETHEKYPFKFRLSLGYTLRENTLIVHWRVTNTDGETMYFSIGGHPAFACELNHSKLCFWEEGGETCPDQLSVGIIEGDGSGCLSDRTKELPLSDGFLKLSDELFDEDALIVEGKQAASVTLYERGEQLLYVEMPGAPLFGIWSPAGKHAPFVCIEPWFGRCDRVDFDQKLEEREYGNTLEPGADFETSYTITVA